MFGFVGWHNWRWALRYPVQYTPNLWGMFGCRWTLRILFWRYSRLPACTCGGRYDDE